MPHDEFSNHWTEEDDEYHKMVSVMVVAAARMGLQLTGMYPAKIICRKVDDERWESQVVGRFHPDDPRININFPLN
jgi:hypothetical protein